jgi:cytochrome c peroxidase
MMRRCAVILLGVLACAPAEAGDVTIVPVFENTPLKKDELAYRGPNGEMMEISRLDFLVSRLAFQQPDGTWESAPEVAAYCSVGKGALRIGTIRDAENCQAIRFCVGVPPEINKADPAKFGPADPLNPTINGLHWGWAGGYVFAAIEGRWRRGPEPLHGYSFHIANDENLISVELPIPRGVKTNLCARFDVSKVFTGVRLDPREASTHSRDHDPVAARIRDNLRSAFSVVESPQPGKNVSAPDERAVLIAPGAKPYAFSFPAYFPQPALPRDNPLTEEGVALGRALFHDTRLSGKGTQSCATCHQREHGFTDGTRFSRGDSGAIGTRNAMPLLNLAWKSEFFWDGRASSLREQVLMPVQNPLEMNATLDEVTRRLDTADDRAKFAAAFGTTEINPDRVARALEQFVLTLVGGSSKFDEVMRGKAKFTDEEQRGFDLFHTEFDPRRDQFGANCFHCHGGPLFRNAEFANNGLDHEPRDLGRAQVTARETDAGKFAVPTLRNVALTAPYMHDGRFASLEEVIGFYSHGVRGSRTLDPNLSKHPPDGLRIPPEDRDALVAFLKTLTEAR